MPIFEISESSLTPVEQKNFRLEKDLQSLIENNLEVVFNCKLIASEFSTGARHAGRIDSLGLSEEHNPVIIEYKKVESSELINQSLFYLHWIQDHRGDFELAAQSCFGVDVIIDWSDIRVICIAPNYKKYDLHAVQVMGANIELWKYRLFANNSLYLEEILHTDSAMRGDSSATSRGNGTKNPKMVEAGKKAAITRATGIYTFDQKLEGKDSNIQMLAKAARHFILGLDESIEEMPKKFYVAYKTSQNIACLEIKNRHIKLFLKLDPTQVPKGTKNYRDVTDIGHFGTGNVEFTLSSLDDLEPAKDFLQRAYNKVGG